MNLSDKVKNISGGVSTLSDWVGSDCIVVSQETAQTRTNICLSCEFNQKGSFVTESMAKTIRETMKVKKSLGLRTQGIKGLKSCQKCLCYLPLKIWTPIDIVRRHMNPGEFESFPGHCWQVTEKI